MKLYSLGFLYSPDWSKVVLIKKNKPEWQKGLLNGVGGQMEAGENIMDCMVREFREETGLTIKSWKRFCIMGRHPDSSKEQWQVHCFVSNEEGHDLVQTVTTEEVNVYIAHFLQPNQIVSNLSWLLAMSRDPNTINNPLIIHYP